MRKTIAVSVVLMLALTAQRDVAGMREEADHAQGGRLARLASALAKYLVGTAGEQFSQGSTEQGQTTVRDILRYAEMARDAAVKSREYMKQTEIKLRQTQRRLEDVERTLPADDRPPLDAVEKKIQRFRQDLLDAMFSPR
jgi:hypothetical protein